VRRGAGNCARRREVAPCRARAHLLRVHGERELDRGGQLGRDGLRRALLAALGRSRLPGYLRGLRAVGHAAEPPLLEEGQGGQCGVGL
jgi:hypothetical protein